MRITRRTGMLVSLIAVIALAGALAATPVFGGNHGGKGPPEDLKVQARPVFEVQGVVFTDSNEQSGLLDIGVDNEGRRKAVEQRLKQQGISLSSVNILVTQPIVFAATLRDNVRPLEGGLQIAFVDGGLAYYCTLGFNAVRDGVNGFLVNSHCTTDQFKLDGTEHYQPWLSPSSNLAGSEIADPPSFKCVRGKKCRYSDAAYDQLAAGVESALGSIARPDGVNNGSLTIAGSFNIVGEAGGNAAVGAILNKVGRTTGHTQGLVSRSCVDTGVSGSNILLLCQDFVDAGVGGGDSGSPVYEITPDATDDPNNVTLYGILWGGASDGSYFVYSPIANVESELGALTTFGAAPPPVASGTIAGKVTESDGTTPISGASVVVEGTSLSATTDANGDYSIGNVPEGTYDVTASAGGFVNETKTGISVTADTTTPVNFALAAAPAGATTVSVDSITYGTEGGKNGDKHLLITVAIVDDLGNPVGGASVSIDLFRDGTLDARGTGTTGTDGTVTFSRKNAKSGCYTTDVTEVIASGLTFDGSEPANQFCK